MQSGIIALTAAAVVVIQLALWKKREKKLPPGPKKLPFVDNLLNMPRKLDCFKFAEFSQEHNSDIIHMSALGTSIVVLNKHDIARELFEKRSGLYSDRVASQIMHNLSPCGLYFAFSLYGDWWRACRRMFVQHFGSDNHIEGHRQWEAFYVRRFLAQLLHSPDEFRPLIRHLVGSITISRTYGTKPHPVTDDDITLIQGFAEVVAEVVTGTYLVDVLPILRHIPIWFPGATFRRLGRDLTHFSTHVRDALFDSSKKAMESPDARRSFVSESLQELPEGPNHEDELVALKYTAAQVYAAGADTTVSSISSFFLAMITHQDVQRKIQMELDSILQGRLPTHEDLESLPYLSAVVMEVLRWWPVIPLGIPHRSVMDDVYEGYFIPKGSILVANQWHAESCSLSMLHNPEDYPDPEVFKPERFLKNGQIDKSIRDPSEIAFGYGRRICPGQKLAKSIVMITIGSVLSMFDLRKKVDSNGREIEPNLEFDSAFLCHPKEFPCTIKPRTPKAAETIRSWALEEDPDLTALGGL